MTTNERLVELERDLEVDLLRARSELELGRDEALGELDAHREALGGRAEEAVAEIRSLVREAEEDLQLVQGRLGELNYFLAEEEMSDLAVFDSYRDRILGALNEAKGDLSRLKTRGAAWAHHEEVLDDAWRRLSLRFDSVRKHLALETSTASREFERERGQLAGRLETPARLETDKRPQVDIVARLRGEFQQALPGIKAMFMYADAPEQRVGGKLGG